MASKFLCLLIFTLVILFSSLLLHCDAASRVRSRRIARQAHRETVVASTIATVIGGEQVEPCTAGDCTERGTCFGTKAAPLCLCQLGYAGKNCQDTYCDSNNACNGHGWCMGTSSQFTCLCNIGFTGERCEKEVQPLATTIVQTASHGPTTPQPKPSGSGVHQVPAHSSAGHFINQPGFLDENRG